MKALNFHFSILFFFIATTLQAQFKLVKVDEFNINSLYPVEIVDFNVDSGRFLGYEKEGYGFTVLLVKENGEIDKKQSLKGQGPGKFNSAMNFLGFGDKGDVWVITPNQLITYDYHLEHKGSEKFALNNAFFTSLMSQSPIYYYKNGNKSSLAIVTYPSGTASFMKAKSLEKEFLVEVFNLEDRESSFLAPVGKRPFYRSLDNSVATMYNPIFVQDKESARLFVTATLDNEITVIDLQTEKVLSNIKINHGDFGSFKNLPISDRNLPSYPPYTLASINRKILYLDGELIVLDYVREIPSGTFKKKRTDDPSYHHFNDPFYHRLILFNQKEQLSKDIALPKNGKLMISLPGNRLLFQIIDPEVEDDFFRYEIYEVVKG
ncbi:hypothetical protein KI659_18050 [Litoribacter alkaliphilus]|uniref:6-bladed beta-propeller n=1 Tax=Litoribacter ruber TaxID=702568 RepID=A0AAP2CLI4_9BACT|nr:hypothetical protein [Litoribacter alkaliphilus]MBS9525929.1 hypothetical protein [Litoribacter alkaliphilus]